MPVFSFGQRLKIALGGFLTFTGSVILVCAVLAATNMANFAAVFEGITAIILISVAASLNIAGGLILFSGSKNITFSLATNEKKTDKNAD